MKMAKFDWIARGNLGANIGLHWKSAKIVHWHWPMTGYDAGRAASWALNFASPVSPCVGRPGTSSPVEKHGAQGARPGGKG